MQLTKLIKAYGLRFPTSVTADEVEEEPTAVVHREGTTTIKTLGCNLMSHLTIKGLSVLAPPHSSSVVRYSASKSASDIHFASFVIVQLRRDLLRHTSMS